LTLGKKKALSQRGEKGQASPMEAKLILCLGQSLPHLSNLALSSHP